jgi:predicted regulator of Ras-like GTPase activity (Roadblock/LC7/MglB family)
MVPATNSTKPIVSYNIFKLSERGVQESMPTEEIIDSFKEQTDISIIRASKEGVLRDYNVETEFPEVLGAMLATVFGASVTAIMDFSQGEDPVVNIDSKGQNVCIISSAEDIIAAFVPEGKSISIDDLRTLAKQLEESEY